MAWPDIVIGLLLLFGAFRGWRVGLIGELTGMLAFAAAIVAAFTYPGIWDAFVHEHTGLGGGSGHVVALLAYAAVAYTLVLISGFVLGRISKLPILGTLNAGLGAVFGFVKVAIVVWAVLYVALFFPLSPDVRGDLHKSRIASMLASQNAALDGPLRSKLPFFAQPYAETILERHKV